MTIQRPSRKHPATAPEKAADQTSHCCACGKPIRIGEPRWAGDADNRAWHYGCAERAGFTLPWSLLRRRMTLGVAG